MNEIEKLQEYLPAIRKAGGWSCDTFGKFLGLTKQSICNLEHKTVVLNKAQYIAIRTILDYEMEENDVLFMTVKIFLDSHSIDDNVLQKAKTFYKGVSKKEMNFRYIFDGLSLIIGPKVVQRLVYEETIDFWMDRIMI